MTILIPPGLYAGVNGRIIRAAATKLAAIQSASLYDLAVVLGDSCAAVKPAWDRLVAEGYIEGSEEQARPTPKMNELVRARIGKPLSRKKADALIAELLALTKDLNQLGPDEPYAWVTCLAVFGSYLDAGKTELGDLDIAWDVKNRPGLTERMIKTMFYSKDLLSPTRTKIKPKGPYIRLTSMQDLEALGCPYRVIYAFTPPLA